MKVFKVLLSFFVVFGHFKEAYAQEENCFKIFQEVVLEDQEVKKDFKSFQVKESSFADLLTNGEDFASSSLTPVRINFLEQSTGSFTSSSLTSVRINSLESLAEHFTKGFLVQRGQEFFWKMYQNNFFPDPSYTDHGLEEVFKILEQYPQLSKPVFREQQVVIQEKTYLLSQSVTDFVKTYREVSSKKKVFFTRIEENINYWSKVLQIDIKLSEAKKLSLIKEEIGLNLIERLKQQMGEQEIKELYAKLKAVRKRQLLERLKIPEKELVLIKKSELKKLSLENEGLRRVSIAMMDLIHTSAFFSPSAKALLRNQDSKSLIEGLRNIVKTRDHLSREVAGFKDFNDLKESLCCPTLDRLFYDTHFINAKLDTFEKESLLLGFELIKRNYRVRALSLIESPFRGCFGLDCSSKRYFGVGLDPNYVYWTRTDDKFFSYGHITTILGEAKNSKGERIKIAVVDKMQHISKRDLFPMLLAIQESLKEQNYLLGFFYFSKNELFNKMINNHDTRLDFEKNIIPFLSSSELNQIPLKNFQAHDHNYQLDFINFNESMLGKGFSVLKWDERLVENVKPSIQITHGEMYFPYTLEGLSTHFINEILKFRDSTDQEELFIFIKNINLLHELNPLEYSKDKVIHLLISFLEKYKDLEYSFKKKILQKLLEFDIEVLTFFEAFSLFFNEKERKQWIGELSNWKEGKHYRKRYYKAFQLLYQLKQKEMSEWERVFKPEPFELIEEDIDFIFSIRDLSLIKLFYERRGVDFLNKKFKKGNTLLMKAAHYDDTVFKYLVSLGANNFNIINQEEDTVLMIVIADKNLNLLKFLLSKKELDINLKNLFEESALKVAIDTQYLESIQELVLAGAEITEDILELASHFKNPKLMSLLKDNN